MSNFIGQNMPEFAISTVPADGKGINKHSDSQFGFFISPGSVFEGLLK